MRRRLLLPLLLSPLLIAGTSHAEPKLQNQVQSFDVSGASVDTIRASLNRQRQHSANRVNWRFNWESTPGQCRITDVQTEVSVTLHQPRLLPDPQRPASVQGQWDAYLLALQAHQEGHVELALNSARDIERAIMALPPANSCDQLQASANATGRRLQEKLAADDREYDERTQQGTLEGAHFP
jgi:predicted secreted Zn-dependent protease